MRRVEDEVRRLRLLRGVAAAFVATFTALLVHLLGGGQFPSFLGLLVPLTFSLLVCVRLAGRKLSFPRLAIAITVSQTFFHTLFSIFVPRSAAGLPTGGSHGGHQMPMGPLQISGDAAAVATISPAMLALHACAAAVTTLAFHWSEVVLARLAALARLVLRVCFPLVVVSVAVPERIVGTVCVEVSVDRMESLLSPLRRRGPPLKAF